MKAMSTILLLCALTACGGGDYEGEEVALQQCEPMVSMPSGGGPVVVTTCTPAAPMPPAPQCAPGSGKDRCMQ